MNMVLSLEKAVVIFIRFKLLRALVSFLPDFELGRLGLFEKDVRSGVGRFCLNFDVVISEVDHPIQIILSNIAFLYQMSKLSHVSVHKFSRLSHLSALLLLLYHTYIYKIEE